MSHIIDIALNALGGLDYASITFLMALESSIFPVPAEAVMIPAWFLAAGGKLDPVYAIIFGTIWSLIWATLNYYILGQLIGKPFLLKYGKYVLIKEKDYHRTEKLFLKNDALYTFLGRLIPVVRHLISIPAWIFKMPFGLFAWMTVLGAWIWCTVLVLFWYYFWESVITLVENYTKPVWYVAVVFVAVYLYLKVFRRKK